MFYIGKHFKTFSGYIEKQGKGQCFFLKISSHLCFSANAHSWLTNINQELHNGTEVAGITGSEQEDCQIIYPCNQTFTNYRYNNRFSVITKVIVIFIPLLNHKITGCTITK